jgi:Spx/MgsR family transcriptional regulator
VVTLYGIKNCDSVKKARSWLDMHGIEYSFHDFREQGITAPLLQAWLNELGWETLLNRRSTSWKQLDEATREAMDERLALEVTLEHPTLIKRPLLDTGASRHVGFKESEYAELFQKHTL